MNFKIEEKPWTHSENFQKAFRTYCIKYIYFHLNLALQFGCWNIIHSVSKLFSPLIASTDSCSFFFLLSSAIFPFTCNFMLFIKLRTSAGISGYVWGVQGCMRVCMGMRECAWLCASVRGCGWVCAGVCGYARVCACVRMCVGWIFRISSRE